MKQIKPKQLHETELIRDARTGDRDAFRQLVFRYQSRVLSVAFRILGNSEDAKDAAQEVFIRLYKFLPSFKVEKRFFTWLYRITVNVCYDHLKREKRFLAIPLEDRFQISEHDSVLDTDSQQQIVKLLDRLSTAQKTAFLLREIEDLSCKEIAEILSCPVSTVRSHLFLARKRLKEIITKEYPEYLEGYTS